MIRLASVAVRLLVLFGCLALMACGGGSSPGFDEAGVRAWARENHPTDVDAVVDAVRDICELDDEAFGYALAGARAEGQDGAVVAGCPDRIDP